MAGLTGRAGRVAVALVALHYAVNLAHGVAHRGIPVPLTGTQTAFVALVVGAVPLVALGLLRRGRTRFAWELLATALFAGFLFGVAFHYVLATPDHVANVPAGPWNLPFGATAALVAIVDGAGAVLAGWFAIEYRRNGRVPVTESTT